MKLLVCVALLALPAAALAAPPPHEVKAASVAAVNLAWTCGMLRDTRPVLFAKAFGRNGYRACVASSAHATRPHRSVTVTLRGLALTAAGTAADTSGPECRQSADGCTLRTAGTVTGLLSGAWSATWTVLWNVATPNLQNGVCAPAFGTGVVELPGLGSLSQDMQGVLCELGPAGPGVVRALRRGTFVIRSAEGSFRLAAGSGSLSFALRDAAAGTFAYSELRLSF
jgi:hypothetical protein